MNTQIFTLETVDKDRWNAFAIAQNSVGQTYEWARAHVSRFGEPLFLVVEENGRWMGGWTILKEYFLRIRVPKFFFVKILGDPFVVEESRRSEILEILWQEIEGQRPLKVVWRDYSTVRWQDESFLKTHNFQRIFPYGSHIVNLLSSEEELWQKMHKKHRNGIRHAKNIGVTVKESKDIDLFVLLSGETYRRSGGVPPAKEELSLVFRILNSKQLCSLYVAYHNERPLAAAYMLHCGKRVTYWHGATADDGIFGASNLLHWELTRLYKRLGYHWYDFGGANLGMDNAEKIHGINRFKERFGGELEYYYGGEKIYSRAWSGIYSVLQKAYSIVRRRE